MSVDFCKKYKKYDTVFVHAGWFCSMPYKVIVNAIKSGYVFVAVRKGEIINGE